MVLGLDPLDPYQFHLDVSPRRPAPPPLRPDPQEFQVQRSKREAAGWRDTGRR